MHEDTLATIVFSIWLYGCLAVWPFARWVLRRKASECRVLLWIFFITLALQVASHVYIWDLYQARNRDAFMAWLFPQAIASISWVASLTVLAFVVFGGKSASRTTA